MPKRNGIAQKFQTKEMLSKGEVRKAAAVKTENGLAWFSKNFFVKHTMITMLGVFEALPDIFQSPVFHHRLRRELKRVNRHPL